MLSIILTWIGAVFAMVVLLVMAFGSFIVDLEEVRDNGGTRTSPESGRTPCR